MSRDKKQVFIDKANALHNSKFNYDKVVYIKAISKIIIVCPIHGDFQQSPNSHLSGCGCPRCVGRGLTTESFIKAAADLHQNRYSYSRTLFQKVTQRVIIICAEHGEFHQTPSKHLIGRGCPQCGGSQRLSLTEFIDKANIVHENKYNYEQVNYHNWKTPICISCPTHGEFSQKPNKHLTGDGCPQCGGSQSMTLTEFIDKASRVHKNKYEYSEVIYTNNCTKVKINCPKHGIFNQRPNKHLTGDGCPVCNESHGERKIRSFLSMNNIVFSSQYKIAACKNIRMLPFDFAIFDKSHKLVGLIEYQGEQHYGMTTFGSQRAGDKYESIIFRDNIKLNYCNYHNIPLLLIPYWEQNNIDITISKFIEKI